MAIFKFPKGGFQLHLLKTAFDLKPHEHKCTHVCSCPHVNICACTLMLVHMYSYVCAYVITKGILRSHQCHVQYTPMVIARGDAMALTFFFIPQPRASHKVRRRGRPVRHIDPSPTISSGSNWTGCQGRRAIRFHLGHGQLSGVGWHAPTIPIWISRGQKISTNKPSA